MRIFYAETAPDYSRYTFPYAVYGVWESPEDLDLLYENGFLPYSDIRFFRPEKPLFYKARSVRVDLAKFRLTSENRRIRRKTASLELTYEILPKSAVSLDEMLPVMEPYIRERIGEAMPAERVKYIYRYPLLNRIAVFYARSEPAGYVWLIENERLRHYWFAFFRTDFWETGLGKRMMEQMITDAAETGKRRVYLGTCYGEKALYKVRDFKGVEFHDGNRWSKNSAVLKQKCKTDGYTVGDDLKSNPEYYREFWME